MKKFLVSSLAAFAAVAMLSGCHAHKSESANKAQITKSQAEVIKFTGVNDAKYVVTLSSTDKFNTAVLEDSKGRKINLKNAVTASGVRLANDNGAEITFKRGEGILNLAKGGEDIFLRYDE